MQTRLYRCYPTAAYRRWRLGRCTLSDQESAGLVLPLTVSQWIHDALIPLTDTDLLRGRLLVGRRVSKITTVPVELEEDENGEELESIPPDFRLTIVDHDDQTESLDVESVIVAVGRSQPIELGFAIPAPYFFSIGSAFSDHWEESLLAGHREIVDLYARLAGRNDLDLYRPKRI